MRFSRMVWLLALVIAVTLAPLLGARPALAISGSVYVNQRGFTRNDAKFAVLGTSSGTPVSLSFTLVRVSDNAAVYTGQAGDMSRWIGTQSWHGSDTTGDTYILDFSRWAAVTGRYRIESNGLASFPFDVNDAAYDIRGWNPLLFWDVQDATQTVAWTALNGQTGGHGPSHRDDARQGTNSDPRGDDPELLQQPPAFPTGTRIDTHAGWYDAGDYNMYMGNTPWALYNLLLAYDDHRAYWNQLDTNANGVPDLVEKTRTALTWLLKMRGKDTSGAYDGSCYERVFNGYNGAFDGRPDRETDNIVSTSDDRPLDTDKWADLCVRAALAGAAGARIWQPYDAAAAATYLSMAQAAYTWSKSHPTQIRPKRYGGGLYFGDVDQGLVLAAVELYRATGTISYLQDASGIVDTHLQQGDWVGPQSWDNLGSLALQRFYPYATAQQRTAIVNQLSSTYIQRISQAQTNPYAVTSAFLGSFGFTASALGAAEDALWLFGQTGNRAYYDFAVNQLAWVWGRNNVNTAFVATAQVSRFPQNLHTRVTARHPLEGTVLPGAADNVNNVSNGIPDFQDDYGKIYYTEPTINANAQYLRTVTGLHHASAQLVPADRTAPSAPAGLTATAADATTITLRWNASTDNVAVTSYQVYRDGGRVSSTSSTGYTDSGRTAGTTYRYTVTAVDAAGNESAPSTAAVVTTPGTGSQRLVLDDFENGTGRWRGFGDSNSTVTLSTVSPGKVGNGAMQVSYQRATGGWVGAEQSYTTPQNWSGTAQIEFWFRGSGSGQPIRLEVLDNRAAGSTNDTAERWAYTFTDSSSLWRQLVVPWSAFERRSDWQPTGAPNDGFNRTEIRGLNFAPLGGSASFLLDQLQVIQPAYTVLDDFENGTGRWRGFGDANSTVTLSTVSPGKVGNGAMQVSYQRATGGWVGVEQSYTTPQNWSGTAQIEFWFRGSGSGQPIRLEVLDNRAAGSTSDTAERWAYTFTDSSSLWRQLVVPWSAFERRSDWQPTGAPNDGFNRTEVHGLNLAPLGGSASFLLDQLQLGSVSP